MDLDQKGTRVVPVATSPVHLFRIVEKTVSRRLRAVALLPDGRAEVPDDVLKPIGQLIQTRDATWIRDGFHDSSIRSDSAAV